MQMQAENLRIYSLAYMLWHDPAHLHAAQEIRRYLKTFLTSPEGALYTSQDADLIEGKHSGGCYPHEDLRIRHRALTRLVKKGYAQADCRWNAALFTTL